MMMRKIFIIAFLIFVGFTTSPTNVHAERSMTIAAVVNEDAITWANVNDRVRLILASSGLPNTKEIRDKVTPQVITGLIEETLMMQEAARNDITVTKEEIDEAFANLAQQNNFTPEQFEEIMRRQGIPKKTLIDQIKAQGSWTKVVQTVLRPRIDVTDTDVDVRMDRLKSNIGRTEFLVSEIFLPIDRAEDEKDVRTLANKLVRELRGGQAPFPGVAAQFSKAAGAENGGTLGWVQKGQLPQELDDAMTKMEKGAISNAIRTPSGLHILQLRNTRLIEDRTIPGRSAIFNQIGMERLERLQRRTLLDLKAEAFIEKRA